MRREYYDNHESELEIRKGEDDSEQPNEIKASDWAKGETKHILLEAMNLKNVTEQDRINYIAGRFEGLIEQQKYELLEAGLE